MALAIAAIAAVTLGMDAPAGLAGRVQSLGRTGVALLGLLAAALLARPSSSQAGYLAATVWAGVQVPFLAWSPEGSPTAQAIALPLTVAWSTTVDGQLTSYGQYGINLVGVAAIWLLRQYVRDRAPR